jgi:hypothetical protein
MTVDTEAAHSLQFRHPVAPLRKTLQWLAGFSLQGPDFDPEAVYVGFVAQNEAMGLVFSPSTSDFLCRRNFTSKVLHSPLSFICYGWCKTLTVQGRENVEHLSIDQQTKRISLNIRLELYIRGSVHPDSVLIRSNEMQQYAGVYLPQNCSTCFGCL